VAFVPKQPFIHFCSGVGFVQEGGAEGRDRLSPPWCGKKKCEVVVMHIARQWFFILLQKKDQL